MPPSAKHSRYIVLDGMRGIAAIAVMMFHYTYSDDMFLLKDAHAAVDLFFILSGFVIAHSYRKRLLADMPFMEFVGKRVIRLYPMFFLGMIIGAPALYGLAKMGGTDYSLRDIVGSVLSNMMLVPYPNNGEVFPTLYHAHNLTASYRPNGMLFPANPPAWTLFFEFFVNLFCLVLFRLKRTRLVKVILLSYCLAVAYAVLMAFTTYSYNLGGAGWNTSNFFGGFPRVFYGFTFGILLYSLRDDARLSPVAACTEIIRKSPVMVYILLAAAFLFPYEMHGLYYLLLLGIAAPLFVVTGSMCVCQNKVESTISQFLGWISYPVYCLHEPVGRTVRILYGGTGVIPIITAVIATLLVSVLANKYYEEPVRAYLSKKLAHSYSHSN